MDAKTLKALNGSIEKWQNIVAKTDRDLGVKNCPLCQLFYVGRSQKDECNGCPVAESTGKTGCEGSPYMQHCITPTIQCAKAELKFLKSLLPKET